jgi:hypothetical protein
MGFAVIMQPAKPRPQETFISGGYIESLYSLIQNQPEVILSLLFAVKAPRSIKITTNPFALSRVYITYFTNLSIVLQRTGLLDFMGF